MTEQTTIHVGGLSLTVFGYQFPDNGGFWDGNWLMAEAEITVSGTRVTQNGPFVRTDELERFASELSKFLAFEGEDAKLACMEPYLAVSVERSNMHGAAQVDVSLRSNAENREHIAGYVADLSDLNQALGDLRRAIRQYPVRGRNDA